MKDEFSNYLLNGIRIKINLLLKLAIPSYGKALLPIGYCIHYWLCFSAKSRPSVYAGYL